jgi:hypothetical protein
MRATLAVLADMPEESRSGFVVRKKPEANKAPEPTPGAVTSGGGFVVEIVV